MLGLPTAVGVGAFDVVGLDAWPAAVGVDAWATAVGVDAWAALGVDAWTAVGVDACYYVLQTGKHLILTCVGE